MCLLLESIKVLNGRFYNLPYHARRMQASRHALWGIQAAIDLEKSLSVPEAMQQGLYKCRLLYKEEIEKVEWHPYQQRPVNSLRLLHSNHISYAHKYADRQVLQQLFEQRGACDDILLVRQGKITDTFYANIVFFDGDHWYTPLQPLLPGTKRQQLLEEGVVRTADISEHDLPRFSHFRLINAFLDFSNSQAVSTACIIS